VLHKSEVYDHDQKYNKPEAARQMHEGTIGNRAW